MKKNKVKVGDNVGGCGKRTGLGGDSEAGNMPKSYSSNMYKDYDAILYCS